MAKELAKTYDPKGRIGYTRNGWIKNISMRRWTEAGNLLRL